MTLRKVISANLLVLPLSGWAAPLTTDTEFLQKAGYLDAGPIRFYPALVSRVGYDSNIFESADNEVDSTVTQLTPEFTAVMPFNTAMWLLGVQADAVNYSESSDDNFVDRQMFLRGNFDPTHRHRFNVRAGLNKGHDPRGTVLTEGFDPEAPTVDSPDEFTRKNAGLTYEFGARTAKGRLRFGADYLDHRYDNNRDRTRFFDREEVGYTAAFLWRAFPSTSLVLEGRGREINYANNQLSGSSLDSSERTALLGAEWETTAKTTNSFRVGHKRKNFSADDRVDGSNVVWELNTTWRPRSYSILELDVSRSPNETNGTGDFIDTKRYAITWSHDWAPRFGTQLILSHLDQSYEGASREQEANGVQFGVEYRMRRWLTWRLDAAWRERTSNIDLLEFERNRYWLTAQFNL